MLSIQVNCLMLLSVLIDVNKRGEMSTGDVVLIEGQSGGSIVGITPGAALEKKSVRDMAAGLNRLGGNLQSDYCVRFPTVHTSRMSFFSFFSFVFLTIFSFVCCNFLVDIIKPKPPQALPRSVENRNSTTRPESLPKPVNVNVKPPPEVLRRIAGKEITTLFEV